MQTLRSTVYIPLAEQSHQAGQLLEVYAETQRFGEAESDARAIDRDWNIVAANLRAASLYSDGLHVVNAIRKFSLKPSRWNIYQHFKHYAWLDNQRLQVGNNHFENCEGSSAQLGLAIALLLNASDSPIRYALATGCLSTDKHADYDIAIASVSSVPEKLDLLIEKRHSNALPNIPLYCFTPKHYTMHGELYPVAELAQVKQLAALNIEVKPIAWLSEAAKLLKADRTRTLKQDKWLGVISGAIISLLLTIVLYFAWWHNPIHLQILPGKYNAEPFLVCSNHDNSAVSYHDLARDGSMPILPLFRTENAGHNVSIAWKLKPGKTFLSSRYYVAFIHLGEQTGYKVISKQPNSAEDLTVAANQVLEWSWSMQEQSVKQQDNMLLIVLQRAPIAADELNQALAHRFPASKTLNVLQARDFLLPQFPGSYAFSYKSIASDAPCIKP
ncbi:MAG: hypothetical protein ABL903_13880 [Methylococcales bacterium]